MNTREFFIWLLVQQRLQTTPCGEMWTYDSTSRPLEWKTCRAASAAHQRRSGFRNMQAFLSGGLSRALRGGSGRAISAHTSGLGKED